MALQDSDTVEHARLDQVETTIGTAPSLEIRTGSAPATCATADSGTLLCTITLPSDWLTAASSRQKTKSGTWSGTASAGSASTPGHYRIKQGATCHLQGSCGVGSGDINFDGTITSGQTVTISAATLAGLAA